MFTGIVTAIGEVVEAERKGPSLKRLAIACPYEAEGIAISAFTDVKPREVPGYAFIAHNALPPAGAAFIVSFISQRGTGDRIAEFLASRGLVEGADFVLAA